MVLSSADGELRLYDIELDTERVIRTGADAWLGLRPRVRDARSGSFVAPHPDAPDGLAPSLPESLYDIDLDTGIVREVVRFAGEVRGYDWDAAGRRLAYHVATADPKHSFVCLYDADQHKVRLLRRMKRPFGTGLGQRDEILVRWSSSDDYVLVVDAHQRRGVRVLDTQGRDAFPAIRGTFGRWVPGAESLLVYEYSDSGDGSAGDWVIIDLDDGARRVVSLPAAAFRPAFSPSGNRIAYDDGAPDGPSTFVFDLATGDRRKLLGGYGAPLWLGPRTLAMTEGAACPARVECHGWWLPGDAVVWVGLEAGEPRPTRLSSTLNDARLLSTLDVWLPPAA